MRRLAWKVVAPTVTTRNPGNQTSRVGKPVRLPIAATVSNGRAPTYSASGLPRGLSINAQTGLISGTPRTAGRSTVRVRASGRERRLRHRRVHLDGRRPSDSVAKHPQRDREQRAHAVVCDRSRNGCPQDRDNRGRPTGRPALLEQRQRPGQENHRHGSGRQAAEVHRQSQPWRVDDRACVRGRESSGHDRGAGTQCDPDPRRGGRAEEHQKPQGGHQANRLESIHDQTRVEARRLVAVPAPAVEGSARGRLPAARA